MSKAEYASTQIIKRAGGQTNTHENTKTTSTQGKYTHETHTITQKSPLTKGGAHISSLTKTPIMTSPPGQLIS